MLVQACSLNRNILVQSGTIEPAKKDKDCISSAGGDREKFKHYFIRVHLWLISYAKETGFYIN